jgi:hypothetical protein
MDALMDRSNAGETSAPAPAPAPVFGAASMAETPDDSEMDALLGRYQPTVDSEPYHEPVNPQAAELAAQLLEPEPEVPGMSALDSMLAQFNAQPADEPVVEAEPVTEAEPVIEAAPVMQDIPAPSAVESMLAAEPVIESAPAQPAAPAADAFNVADEADDFDAIADSMFGGLAADVDMNEIPEPAPQPAPFQSAPMPQVQPAAMPGMIQPAAMPQFMGYDPAGNPIYSYPQPAMPQGMQFMGYNQAGQPVYAQPAPAAPQGFIPASNIHQPVAPAPQVAPAQPAPAGPPTLLSGASAWRQAFDCKRSPQHLCQVLPATNLH